MAYRITRAECLATISGVCSRCGGKLEPIETVDNSNNPTFWTGCLKCSRFDSGVSQKTYRIAKELVENEKYHFRPYSHIRDDRLDDKETRKYKHEQQISGACEVVNNVLHIAAKAKEG